MNLKKHILLKNKFDIFNRDFTLEYQVEKLN